MSVVSGAVNAIVGREAADDAKDAQLEANDGAIAEQRRQFDTVQGNSQFARSVGQNSLGMLADLFGVGRPTNTNLGLPDDLETTPGRQVFNTDGGVSVNSPYTVNPQQNIQAQQPVPVASQQPAATPSSALTSIFDDRALGDARQYSELGIRGRNQAIGNTNLDPRSQAAFLVGNSLNLTPAERERAAADPVRFFDTYAGGAQLPGYAVDQVARGFVKENASQIGDLLRSDATADQFFGGQLPQTQQQPAGNLLAAQQQRAPAPAPSVQGQGYAQGLVNKYMGGNRPLTQVANQQLDMNNQLAGRATLSGEELFNTSLDQNTAVTDYLRDNFEQDPGYEFALAEAERAIKRNGSANGTLESGGLRDQLVRNAVGMAQQQYGNYDARNRGSIGNLLAFGGNQYNNDRNFAQNAQQQQIGNLFSLAGTGQNATGQVNSAALSTGNNVANLLNNSGQAMAAGITGQANATTGAVNQFGNRVFQVAGMAAGGGLGGMQGVSPTGGAMQGGASGARFGFF